MIRTQIQLTEAQSEGLKQLATREGTTVAELVRQGVDQLLRAKRIADQSELRRRALAVAGKFHTGEADLASEHDRYFGEAFKQ